MLDSKKIGTYFENSNLELFSHIGIILLVFKIEIDIPEEKEWLKMISRWL